MRLRLHALGATLAYAYVLRGPLLVWLVLLALPAVAVPRGADLGPLLRGLFDLSDPLEHGSSSDALISAPTARTETLTEHVIESSAFALVVLASLTAAASIGVTARLILRDGAARFGIPLVPMSPGIDLALRFVIVLPTLFLIAGAASQSASTVRPVAMIAGVGAGTAAFFLLGPLQSALWRRMFTADGNKRSETPLTWVFHRTLDLFEWLVEHTPAGFVDRSGRLLARHVFAWFQMLFSMLLYVLVFALLVWTDLRIPTLCLVLLLAMLVCWGFTALSFLLDRFRVPVVALLVAYGAAVSVFPQGDHYFRSVPRGGARALGPAEVLGRRMGRPVVAVAAMGGGIHAGAWVARVLAGLQEDSKRCGTDFDQALAVVSAVSGGSMGAMYIVDAYRNGRLPDAELSLAVKAAEASSLDDVAWALVYPDLAFSIFPFLKGVSIWPRVSLAAGSNLVLDRGTVLENSWKRTASLGSATLDQWRADVDGQRRPAVIFNATVVETGERMLLGTTTIDGRTSPGRVDFGASPEYATSDVLVVTAARLSSTFPYVTPPARIMGNTVFDRQYHVVDGGYYDNYGIVTLVEWLAKSLESTSNRPSRVMLLGLETFPSAGQRPPDGRRGWIFEATHPLLTLAEVRGAAQQSTAEMISNLLRRAGQTYVTPFAFRFPSRVYQDLDDVSPPLSWHLTADDRKRLRAAWNDPETKRARNHVHRFLTGEADDETIAACIQ